MASRDLDAIVISASPRKGGNCDLIASRVIEMLRGFGRVARFMALRDYRIEPCRSCRRCLELGRCVIDDGMTELYNLLLEAKALIIVTPRVLQ